MYSLRTCAIFVLIVLATSNFEVWSAREGKYVKMSKPTFTSYLFEQVFDSNYHNGYHIPKLLATNNFVGESTQTISFESVANSAIFNVLNYGARGDGKTDDSKAFLSAWTAACNSQQPSTMLVPSERIFLIYPISFVGKGCKNNIVFQLDGKIIAPPNPATWPQGVTQWIAFQYIKGITIQGKGVIDGQGSNWKESNPSYNPSEEAESWNSRIGDLTTYNYMDSNSQEVLASTSKPTAVWIFKSQNVNITGITIQNSPQFNLMFLDSSIINVFDMSVSSNGQNTDGIHLQHAHDIAIFRTNISSGDDCVSIQTGCFNIRINNVNCGPGHGFSIGGLNVSAYVSNVEVRDSTIHDALFGARIKTWQGGSGLVQGVTYSNVQVTRVAYPIVINQYYCYSTNCPNHTLAVAISNVTFVDIRGTYTEEPVHLACSDSKPCTHLTLGGIELKPIKRIAEPYCWKAYGEVKNITIPPIKCLQR